LQSGIEGSEELKQLLGDSLATDTLRLIQVVIDPEAMTLVAGTTRPTEGDWDIDYDNHVLPVLEKDRCCFLLFRLDTTNSAGFDWVFTSYSPDFAAVRDKMVYAATRATLKQLINSQYIKVSTSLCVRVCVCLTSASANIREVAV
jgi:twinfilin-like protein